MTSESITSHFSLSSWKLKQEYQNSSTYCMGHSPGFIWVELKNAVIMGGEGESLMGCSLDEKYDNMSDMRNWDNYLWNRSLFKEQRQHAVCSYRQWPKLGRVMSLVLLITRHLFLWVKHRFSSFRAKAKGNNVAYSSWFMILCQTSSHRPLSWLVDAGFCVGGQLAWIQHYCEYCGFSFVRRWVGDCLLNV